MHDELTAEHSSHTGTRRKHSLLPPARGQRLVPPPSIPASLAPRTLPEEQEDFSSATGWILSRRRRERLLPTAFRSAGAAREEEKSQQDQ
eukprot:129208-Hanusia_phi.AAC.1